MRRRMEKIEVATTTAGMIEIIQAGEVVDDSIVVIDPNQVDVLVKWLREAKKELTNPAKSE